MSEKIENTNEELSIPKEETNNSTKEATNADVEPTKLERSIIHQVEYYFGDANLQRDKFLLGEIAKDDGWVPFDVLLTFNRLSSLSKDVEVIVNALMKSDEGLLEISDDKKKVRRHPERPLPEHTDERRKEIMTRTAYVKGFALDATMSDLVDFFTQFDKVLHITMRKYLDKALKCYKFKGSVFVTFENIDQAKDFIERAEVKIGDRLLLRKWQQKYLEEKSEELKEKKAKKDKKKDKKKEEKIDLPLGAILQFSEAKEDITREILREAIEKIDGDLEIAYIDFSKGDKDGYIRFATENSASKLLEKLTDNKLKLNDDCEIVVRSLTDDEEKTYLERTVEQIRHKRSNFNKKKNGHHFGHNKKRQQNNDGDVAAKKAKLDAKAEAESA